MDQTRVPLIKVSPEVVYVALKYKQRKLAIVGSITVHLTSCLTGLDSTKQVKFLIIKHKKSSLIQTKKNQEVSCIVKLPLKLVFSGTS